ncbi:MAG: hypothetical protein GXZ07_11120 [Firmicutes bacterium]|nr:hypothetical protein [Bacillota bacterium]
MMEKIKSGVLAFLIILSMGLTYRLWFGAPPLEEGIKPKYEDAYFTAPLSLEEIIAPAEIIFWKEEEKEKEHVFRRGEKEFVRLLAAGTSVLKRADKQILSRINDSEEEALLKTASSKITFNFSPVLPLNFLVPGATALDVHRADIILEERYYHIILEGEDKFAGRIFMNLNEQLLNNLVPQRSSLHHCLSGVLTLDLAELTCRELQEKGREIIPQGTGLPADEAKKQGQAEGKISAVNPAKGNEKEETSFSLIVANNSKLFVPVEEMQAGEILLKKENVDKEQLVRAFFFDPSMARRIEERDGAVFFTDGEKGLRIYPSGLVEYTAPKLERVFTPVSYSTALQKGAEYLGLYGGWLPGIYLVRAEGQSEGYRLFWETFYEGLPIRGERVGCEMAINEQGVLFYQRNFYQFIEEVGARQAFRPFEEALCRAALIYKKTFPGSEGILLGIEPVYYLSSGGKGTVKATPAWSVSISGMDTIYLHWQTLESL